MKGHKRTWKCCNSPPRSCVKCENDAKRRQAELEKALDLQERRAREEREHIAHIAKLDALIKDERERIKDGRLAQERVQAVLQKERDLIIAQQTTAPVKGFPLHPPSHSPKPISQATVQELDQTQPALVSGQENSNQSTSVQASSPPAAQDQNNNVSPAKEEWERQKRSEGAFNDAIESLMDMIGLEEVKLQVLKIKAKVETSIRQQSDIKQDRLNIVFLGNPGTGRC